MNRGSNGNDNESLNSSKEQADSVSSDDRYNDGNDYNLPRRFREYKRAAKISSEERGLYVDGHFQEIL